MRIHACLLYLNIVVWTNALRIRDPRPTPTASDRITDSNGRTPKPTLPPRSPLLPRQYGDNVCGTISGDPSSSKVCSIGSTCMLVGAPADYAFNIFACCEIADEGYCESTATTCWGYADNTLPFDQAASEYNTNGTLLCGYDLPDCATAYLQVSDQDIQNESFFCAASAVVDVYVQINTTSSTTSSTSSLQITSSSTSSPLTDLPTVPVGTDDLGSSATSTAASATSPAPSQSIDRTSGSNTSTPAIIGGVIGGIAIMAIGAIVWVVSRKRQIRREAVWNPGDGKLGGEDGHIDPSTERPTSELM